MFSQVLFSVQYPTLISRLHMDSIGSKCWDAQQAPHRKLPGCGDKQTLNVPCGLRLEVTNFTPYTSHPKNPDGLLTASVISGTSQHLNFLICNIRKFYK